MRIGHLDLMYHRPLRLEGDDFDTRREFKADSDEGLRELALRMGERLA